MQLPKQCGWKYPSMVEAVATSSYPARTISWVSVFILLLFQILNNLDRQLLSLLAGPIQKDLGLSDVQLGLLQGYAFALFYASAGLLLGWAVDRYSRRVVIFLGVFTWSLSCAGGGLASGFVTLFLCRIGLGAGESTLVPGAWSMLRDLFPPKRLTTALGVFSIGGTLGIGASYAFGGNLMAGLSDPDSILAPLSAHFRPWQSAFIVAGLLGVLLSFLIFLIPEPRRRQSNTAAEPFLTPVIACFRAHPVLLPCHMLGFSLASVCSYAVIAWTPLYLQRRFGWDSMTIGNALSVVLGVIPTIGSLTVSFIVERFFRAGIRDIPFRAMIMCLVVTVPATIGAFLSSSPWEFLAFLSIMTFTVTGAISSLTAVSLQLIAPPALGGRLTAIFLFLVGVIGVGGGPLMVGIITDYVLQDRAQLGKSLVLSVCVAAFLSALFLAKAMAPFRAAIADVDTR